MVQQRRRAVAGRRNRSTLSPGAQKVANFSIVLLKILRAAWIPLACLFMLWFGMAIGYSVIGDGSAGDIWKFSTWKHVFDLVFAD